MGFETDVINGKQKVAPLLLTYPYGI